RRHDEPATRLLPLAVGLHVVASLEVLVDHLALERTHRFQRHGTTMVDRGLGGLVGRGPQRLGPALAITGSIHRHRYALAVASHGKAVSEMLDGVDRLPVVPDQRS